MIKHIDISSENFHPEDGLLLVKPRSLPKGEVEQNGLVIQMEQNTSVIDRPTFGTVVRASADDHVFLNTKVIWIEQDGIDIELKDGGFIILKTRSILGKVR